MKQTYKVFLLAIIGMIALVIGSLVVRQAAMIPHEEPLRPTPFPTAQINPTITVTIRPDISLLSQGIGGVLQETALAAEGTTITSIGDLTATPTLSAQISPCAFSWAHRDLPEVAQAAQDALSTISMASIQVLRADAYGESCNRANESLGSFAAMTTDFYLSVNVSDLNDSNYLGQVVVTAYSVLKELKVKLPAQPGYLDIVFTAGGTSKDFRAMFPTIKHAIETGKSGMNLLEIGGVLQ